MQGSLIWFQQHVNEHVLFYFIAIYALGVKPFAIITARMCGLNLFLFVPLAVLMDAAQIPFFYYIYGHAYRSRRMLRFSEWLQRKAASTEKKRAAWLKVFGRLGLVFFTMLPLKGCGVWSGVLFARLMEIPIRTGFLLLITGSALASLALAGIGEGIVYLWGAIR